MDSGTKRNGIPSDAKPIAFSYGRGRSGTFYVWEKGGKWQWDALGNNGEAKDKEAAINAAREWIMNGYSPKFD